MKKLTFIVVLLAFSFGYAQNNAEIKGSVLDGEFNNEALAFVKVSIKNTNQNVETDLEGKYRIILEPGIYTFIYEFVGYEVVELKNIVINKEIKTLKKVILKAKYLPIANSIVSKE